MPSTCALDTIVRSEGAAVLIRLIAAKILGRPLLVELRLVFGAVDSRQNFSTLGMRWLADGSSFNLRRWLVPDDFIRRFAPARDRLTVEELKILSGTGIQPMLGERSRRAVSPGLNRKCRWRNGYVTGRN